MIRLPVLAVTMGDPGGIGPEITLKAVQAFSRKAQFILVGRRDVFDRANRLLSKPLLLSPRISLFETSTEVRSFTPGALTRDNGRMALDALRAGIRLACERKVSALVTAPISKAAICKTQPNFIDQTDFIVRASRARSFAMSFAINRSVVTLVTTHLPLKEVARKLKREDIVRKSILTAVFLKKAYGLSKPRLAVLGLNPHAGESGHLGKEEIRIIAPAVRALKRRGYRVFGPLPADSAFYAWQEGKYDAVIAMYHDQGLAPFKMLYFDRGVHLTLGLPFIRTSPDHGTAFSIAYQNKARPDAMKAAIDMAIKLSRS